MPLIGSQKDKGSALNILLQATYPSLSALCVTDRGKHSA